MGAGAGYKITTEDIYLTGKVTDAKIVGKNEDGVTFILCDCDMTGTIGSFRASSYYYGTEEIDKGIDVVVTKALIVAEDEDKPESLVKNTDELAIIVRDGLEKIEYNCGGGWLHKKWDGTISNTEDAIKHIDDDSAYGWYVKDDMFVVAVDAEVLDKELIEYVDKAVQGDNFYEEYYVYDSDNDLMNTFETEEEAIEECNKHEAGSSVEKLKVYYNADGESDFDTPTDSEIVYTKEESNESLKEEDDTSNIYAEEEEVEDATGKDPRVRDWYVSAFPNDELGWDIKQDVTFTDVLKAINDGTDVYAVIGVDDSVIRERVFDKLSDITGVAYDDIYEKWLNNANRGKE